MKNESTKPSIGQIILWLLAGFGIVLILYRFVMGLGAVTNLSDGYPWGLWIGFDILAGGALAAGGFVMAGTVYLFGGRRFYPLARTAILTAFLGYLLYIFGLCVDLGRPWNIWSAIFFWNRTSPMFEISWCVMLYTTVLLLEFLPVIFKRYRMEKLHTYWNSFVPLLIIVMLGLFTLAMTYSFKWTLIIVLVLLAWEMAMRTGLMPRDKQMPILLIMAGVMISILYQSALGSLFLIVPLKLHALWHTPILPFLFLFSAIMTAPAMVSFETLMSEKTLGHKAHFNLLTSLVKVMPYLLSFYLLLKIADLVVRGAVINAFMLNWQAFSWWLEITIGVIVPLILFLMPEVRSTRQGIFWSSILVVVGLIWNRLNVSVVGIIVEEWPTYYPLWSEIFITIGIISIGLIVFKWAVENLPIYESETMPNI